MSTKYLSSVLITWALIFFQQKLVMSSDCTSRGTNCTSCLSDGHCGFCDSCGDYCHQSKTLHSFENCTHCAQCVPGTLSGPKKGHTCRHEWYYINLLWQISPILATFANISLHQNFQCFCLNEIFL